ncbi:lipopolysaccharide assembly protein LapA domain-containing protein [Lacimicrobium alkaliphilum]|uniref:Lipopolysaccharide assembly protein A domain-containing protein n=1 Tax=Lacimicrobium alkaliphilum TaxID=1526571 RepID=A0ABQ1QZQ0_9ALTE|nr:LapA family protein [Lacimicrobium alkaliphilum]GGD53049.1 hypothetical protein GCM10011357_06140 [Lacimicrobium alkaliphilum]
MKLILALLLALLVFLLALALGAQNDQLIRVNYLIAQSQLPLSALMAICFVGGVAVTVAIWLLWFMGYRLKVRRRTRTANTSPGS